MSQIGEAHFDEHAQLPAWYLPWWLSPSNWRTRRVAAFIHFRDDTGEVRSHEISAWFLDMEIHGGQLVFINAHDEECRVPVDSLMTLEIR
jgi:hypothetical protein